jgi:hypothetical protein
MLMNFNIQNGALCRAGVYVYFVFFLFLYIHFFEQACRGVAIRWAQCGFYGAFSSNKNLLHIVVKFSFFQFYSFQLKLYFLLTVSHHVILVQFVLFRVENVHEIYFFITYAFNIATSWYVAKVLC